MKPAEKYTWFQKKRYIIPCYLLVFLLLIISRVPLYSQERNGNERGDGTDRLVFQFPALEYPFNVNDGYRFPGMYQSLHLAKSGGELLNEGMGSLLSQRIGTRWTLFSITLFDLFVLSYIPPGDSWLHEEWHRAVLSNRKINSFNDVYTFDFFAETIAVSHVKDEDLARLKREHPAEMVRLSEAGIEAQYEMVKASRLNYFTSGKYHIYQVPYWWMNILNSVLYIKFSGTTAADTETDRMNREETTIEERDFVGFDFTAWVYDLFRPDEPYSDRGAHPSGTGIDRYIRYSDLTDEEKKFLKLQFRLSLINFVSPHLFGFNRFTLRKNGEKAYWNFACMHFLTSFGYTVDIHGMFKYGIYNLDFTYHNYRNYRSYFPGLEIALARYPVSLFHSSFFLSARCGFWLQPEDQKFRTSEQRPGGLLGAGVSIPVTRSLNIFLNSDCKSEGWVAGSVSLEAEYRVVSGIEALL